MRPPVHSAILEQTTTLVQRALRYPKEHAFAFGAIFSMCKTAFSDAMVQTVVEKRSWEQYDVKRTASFGLFGLVYLGGVQYSLYVPIFGRMFPQAAAFAAKPLRMKVKDVEGMKNVLKQVFIDQCVHHPLMYFPAFYAIRELADGNTLADARERYLANFKDDVVALWKIWIVPTMCNFAFSPMWLRIPVVATTSLVWTCVLSAMRGASDDIALPANTGGSAIALLREMDRRTPLDASAEQVVVSATGADRVGVVAQLSHAVSEAGGNVYVVVAATCRANSHPHPAPLPSPLSPGTRAAC